MKFLLYLLLSSSTAFAFQSKFTKTQNGNVLKKEIYYDDGVLAREKFYDKNKKLDSVKTYYKSGELDELFYYNKSRYHGLSIKLNRFGDTITTWEFKNRQLLKRKDNLIISTEKTDKKVRSDLDKLRKLNDLLKQKPNDTKSRYTRARIRRYLGNRILALNDFKKIETILKKNSKQRNIPEKMWGSLYDHLEGIYASYEMENYAIHYRLKALKASPSESRLYHNFGAYLVRLKYYKVGIEFLKKANEMVPNHSFANWIMAIAYSDLEQYDKAMKCVTIAFKNEGNLYKKGQGTAERDLWTTRGLIAHKLGNTKAGIADLEKALMINPDNTFALKNLGIVYLEIGDNQQACTYFNKAKSLEYEKIHDFDDLAMLLKMSCEPMNLAFTSKASLRKKPFAYPNPVENEFYIKNFEFPNFEYQIYDYTSKLVVSGSTHNALINVESLPSGLYILKIEKEGFSADFKIIKN